MKILWISKKKFDQTVDRTTWIAMVQELQSLGHRVILLTGATTYASDWGLGRALRYSRAPSTPGLFHIGFQVDVCRALHELVGSSAPDVVIFDPLSAPGVSAGLLGRRGQRPTLVMDIRSLPTPGSSSTDCLRRGMFSQGMRVGLRRADAISVITSALRDELITQRLISASMATVEWASGVDTRAFDPRAVRPSDVAALRQRVGAQEGPVFLYHGAMDVRRGLDDLIRAFAALRAREGDDAKLVFVGDGRSLAELRSLSETLGLASSVFFSGAVPHAEIPRWIAAADIGVLPFPDIPIWRTSSPIKLFEYLAMERPVLVTDIRAHRDVLGASPCAFYAESSAPDALADAMVVFLHTRSRLIGAPACRRLVEASYTWTAQATRLAACIESLRRTAPLR